MSKVMSTLNEQPIVFYGKVVDQSNSPVPYVTVTGTAAHSQKFLDEKFDAHTTLTDSDGLFSFEGLSGMHLGIALKKEGYQYTSNNNSFTYSAMWPENERHKPDANAPVIFKMWKLQGPQVLTPIRVSAYIHCDGTPVAFDLLTGRRAPNGGDLTVSFTRNPIQVQGLTTYDWTLGMNVSNGGMVEMNDQYPNEAPSDGYQSQLDIDMPNDAVPWQSQLTRSYYLKIRGQQYGRVTLFITTGFDDPPQAGLGITGFINPNYSRNLESSAATK